MEFIVKLKESPIISQWQSEQVTFKWLLYTKGILSRHLGLIVRQLEYIHTDRKSFLWTSKFKTGLVDERRMTNLSSCLRPPCMGIRKFINLDFDLMQSFSFYLISRRTINRNRKRAWIRLIRNDFILKCPAKRSSKSSTTVGARAFFFTKNTKDRRRKKS